MSFKQTYLREPHLKANTLGLEGPACMIPIPVLVQYSSIRVLRYRDSEAKTRAKTLFGRASTVSTRIQESCAMSLELPLVVRRSIFFFFLASAEARACGDSPTPIREGKFQRHNTRLLYSSIYGT